MDQLHTHYRLTIEVISPVHIGTGTELILDHDFVVRDGRTWVIDQEALWSAALDEKGTFNTDWAHLPSKQFLEEQDYRRDSPFFRYIIPGEPTNRPLREQIKDVWGHPYVPGSSVKGMLRTLLMWGLVRADGERKIDLRRLKDSRSWAGQPVEQALLSPASDQRNKPNKDVLKALRVQDSQPVTISSLHVVSANVYPTSQRGGRGVNVDAEAFKPGTSLQLQIGIDEYGFADARARAELGWEQMRVWFDRFAAIGRAHAGVRIAEEYEFHEHKGPSSSVSFYRDLYRRWNSLEPNEWFAQIGWGTGWRANTLNDLLTTHPDFKTRVLDNRKFSLGRGRYDSAAEFPKSRKLILRDNEASIPLGWVKCRLESVDD